MGLYLSCIIYIIYIGYEGMFRDLDDAEDAFNAIADKEEMKIIVPKGMILTPDILSQETEENEKNEKGQIE